MGDISNAMMDGELCCQCGGAFHPAYYKKNEKINMPIIEAAEQNNTIEEMLDENDEISITGSWVPTFCESCYNELSEEEKKDTFSELDILND